MITTALPKPFRLRSFVRRSGRQTKQQEQARHEMWPTFGLQVNMGEINYSQVFGRVAPCFLEIGFGSGQSLLALAKAHPEYDFIGVETHKPGIGALLLGVQVEGLTNLRIYDADVIDVLQQVIPHASLAGVQIFFPDPWPKRRHHARRLIQPAFLKLLISKLIPHGTLDLATDWDDYAKHMMQVLSAEELIENFAGKNNFATRSSKRPILTKFERRALRAGRQIWELQFGVKRRLDE